jgi:hypothetical protein
LNTFKIVGDGPQYIANRLILQAGSLMTNGNWPDKIAEGKVSMQMEAGYPVKPHGADL